jgi:hypothetical protein
MTKFLGIKTSTTGDRIPSRMIFGREGREKKLTLPSAILLLLSSYKSWKSCIVCVHSPTKKKKKNQRYLQEDRKNDISFTVLQRMVAPAPASLFCGPLLCPWNTNGICCLLRTQHDIIETKLSEKREKSGGWGTSASGIPLECP